ncbi:MAG: winged helix-turn-helix domain-containing protein [Methanosarcinaceae archaeon]|nr:winged helix-turn-helix domain-containing protein [Methanosarcinaceae archaeon]MDD4331933.1 winged helix-turn-helix domain-containing protein [Methanosarcinaceae archaeon]
MNRPLLELIFLSEKRTELLLLLKPGPKKVEELMNTLELNQVAILPHIKKLKDKKLLIREGELCSLSPLGKAVVGRMEALILTIRLFSKNPVYWKSHLIEAIPAKLLEKIQELEPCSFSKTLDNVQFFEPIEEIKTELDNSQSIKGLAPVFHPLYPDMFLDFAEKGAKVSLIVTAAIFERLKSEYFLQLEKFIKLKNTRFYVCEQEIKLAAIQTERFLALSLFFSNGSFDHRNKVLSSGPEGLKWGTKLFEYFCSFSEEITKI